MKKEQEKLRNSLSTIKSKVTEEEQLKIKINWVLYNIRNKPEWMILTSVPGYSPELRPLVPLDGGRFATSILMIYIEELLIEIIV